MNTCVPLVSVVIAVRNGSRTLQSCLESLAVQTYPRVEIIVVDDGSRDATSSVAQAFAVGKDAVVVLQTAGVGPSEARNRGIAAAQGEYIAFTDGDCLVAPDWIDELIRGFCGAADVVGVGGDQQSPPDESPFGRLVSGFMKTAGLMVDYVKNGTSMMETAHNPTCNVVYRRDVFTVVGTFLPGLWPGEDVELDYRIRRKGYRLRYTPRAVVYHYRTSSLSGFGRMMWRYGQAQAKLVKKYGVFRKIQAVPLVVIAVAVLVLLVGGLPIPMIPVIAGVGVVAGFLWYVAKTGTVSTSLSYLMLAAVALVCWHAGFYTGLGAKRI
jgi:glycosyltransferase involved in cell wall biosynthesis